MATRKVIASIHAVESPLLEEIPDDYKEKGRPIYLLQACSFPESREQLRIYANPILKARITKL